MNELTQEQQDAIDRFMATCQELYNSTKKIIEAIVMIVGE